jgi:hypothetical protein
VHKDLSRVKEQGTSFIQGNNEYLTDPAVIRTTKATEHADLRKTK